MRTPMPRKSLTQSNDLPYHLTARANNREPFFITPEETWKILVERVKEIQLLYDAQIHALVLMSNHLHMIMTTPNHPLGEVMQRFMQSVTRAINVKSGRSGRVFGARFHGNLIRSADHFATVYKYDIRNPVKAGICDRVEDYAFSSLRFQLGNGKAEFPLHYPFAADQFLGIPNDTTAFLKWLNRPFKKEFEEAIRKGMRRSEFEMAGIGWKRSESDPDTPEN